MRRSLSLFAILFLLASPILSHADVSCECVPFAANWHGVSLICDGKIVERFAFVNDPQAAMAACEAAKEAAGISQ